MNREMERNGWNSDIEIYDWILANIDNGFIDISRTHEEYETK